MQADWEFSKENFQPLKRGRKEVCSDEAKSCQKEGVESQRRRFWQELDANNGDDPLATWIRFIKWTQDTFRAGGHQAELLPLLERCTRELQDKQQYKSDIRYLRIWIQYADCLPEPRDVFRFLKENDIGQDFALYYLAYAAYMELRGNFAKADAIFQDGLARLAHPIDRLRTKYEDFQYRMAKRIERKEQGVTPAEAANEPVRSSLAVLSVQNKGRPAEQSNVPGAFAFARQKRKATAAADKENGSGLDIYVDDAFKPGKPALGLPPAAPTGLWTKLGSDEQNRKENVQKASQWAGQKLSQKGSLLQPAIPALDIPVDEDIRDQPSPQHVNAVPKSEPLEGQAYTTAQCYPHNSSQHSEVASKAIVASPPPAEAPDSAFSAVGPRQHNRAVHNKKQEVPAYNADLLQGDSAQEVSFEELRASKWLARHVAPAQQAIALEQNAIEHMADPALQSPCLPAVKAAPDIPEESGNSLTLLSPKNAAPSVPSSTSPANATSPMPARPVHRGHLVSHSQPALMAERPRPHSAAYVAPSTRIGKGPWPAPANPASPTLHTLRLPEMTQNVTLATKDAFACVNAMFSSSLCHDSGPSLRPASLAEPTVTISTKAAFAELNCMFSSDLPHHRQHAGSEKRRAFQAPMPRKSLGKRSLHSAQLGADTRPSSSRVGIAAALRSHHTQKGDRHVVAGQQSLHDTEKQCAGHTMHQQPKPVAVKLEQTVFGQHSTGGAVESLQIREDTQRLAKSPSAAAGQGASPGGFAVYEDTQYVSKAEPDTSPAGFCIREDTQFMNKTGQASPDSQNDDADVPSPAGLGIYEDTQFMDKQSHAAAETHHRRTEVQSPGGIGIYEDTQFVNKGDQAAAEAQGADMQSSGGLGIYEDTQFVGQASTKACHTADEAASPGGLSIYEDTQFVSVVGSRHAGKSASDAEASPHELGIYEDTQFGPKAGKVGVTAQSQQADVKHEAVHGDQKENLYGLGRGFARDIGSPAAQAIALQPITGQRARNLGLPDLEAKHAANGTRPVQVQDLDRAMQHLSPFREQCKGGKPALAAAAPDACAIDPFHASVQARLLSGLEPPLEQWADVVLVTEEGSDFDKLKQVKRQAAKPISLQVGSQFFMAQQKVGQGAFASVYQVARAEDTKRSSAVSPLYALKIQLPPCPWEFYICKVLQGRVPPTSRSLFLTADMLYLSPKHSGMLTPCGKRGTLQDLLNAYMRKGKRMDEAVVMYYTLELLSIATALHAAHVIHTDIKPDNLLLREPATSALPPWQPYRAGPWAKTGLCLIDFGRAVDTALLPPNTLFKGDSCTEAFRCVEMQEGRPWSWGVDAFGVCSSVHCLLFGDYMQVEKTISSEGSIGYRLKSQLKRHWTVDLWQTLFDTLLQPGKPDAAPSYKHLLDLFHQHLSANPAIASKLRSELVKQDNIF